MNCDQNSCLTGDNFLIPVYLFYLLGQGNPMYALLTLRGWLQSHEFPCKHERDSASDAWKCRFLLVALSGKFSQEEGKNGLAIYGALVDDTELPFVWNPAPLLAVDSVRLPQPNRCRFRFQMGSRWFEVPVSRIPGRGEPQV